MLHALNKIAIATTNGTEKTAAAVAYFLNYCASNPEPSLSYRASDMILSIDSDAAYLVEPQARSRMGGYHYLGNKDGKLFNAPIHVLAKVIKNVVASAAEAEVAGLFINAQDAVPERTTLIELGHPQPATPIRTDNSTANGIINGTIKQKRSKAIDMRFYWLKDRAAQNQFKIFWAPGSVNLADYFTKIHPPSHHKKVRPIYLYDKDNSPLTLQGCVKILQTSTSTLRAFNKPVPDDRRHTDVSNASAGGSSPLQTRPPAPLSIYKRPLRQTTCKPIQYSSGKYLNSIIN
jgi:hypothetical protein